jgi:ion channel-forming bestrophin family protein
MIVRPRLHWLRMLFVWRGSVLRQILPQLALIALLSTAVVWTHGTIGGWKLTLTATPFTLFGVALAIFLGFRNNASYERFWEARKLWGALINDSRSVARQVMTLTTGTPEEKRRLVYLLIALVHALRHQLRNTDGWAELAPLVDAAQHERVRAARFRPAVLLLLFSEELSRLRRAGRIEPILAASFEPTLGGISHIIGGCERIANTPIPFTYSVIIHRVVYLYCLMLPFGLVDTIGVLTPLVVTYVTYTFIALETLSDEIEEPFGTSPNDLALEAMSRAIEITLRETLAEPELLAPLQPDAQCVLR